MEKSLSYEELDLLKYLDEKIYISREEAFRLFSPYSDYSLEQLFKQGYISSRLSAAEQQPVTLFVLTDKGKSFINDYKISQSKKMKELQQVRADALFAKVISVLALFISIAAIIVQILF